MKINSIKLNYDVIRVLFALLLSIFVTIVIILIVSDQRIEAISKFLVAPLSSKRYLGDVLDKMMPLMFTGLAAALIFNVKVFNLSLEGAFYCGGVMASAIACMVTMLTGVHAFVALLIGGIVGAVVVFIPGILKLKFEANEVVSSLMLNYILFKLGDWTLRTFLRDPSSTHVTSYKFHNSARLPESFGLFSSGVYIVIVLLIISWIMLYKTKHGYEIRLTGQNPNLANISGMKVGKIILTTQIIAGFVSGLGGATYMLGTHSRLGWQWRSGYGWDGLVIAIMAKNNPAMIPITSLILAYLRVGSEIMSRSTDVQNEIVSIVQSIIIVLVASQGFLETWRKRRIVEEKIGEKKGEE